MQNSVCSKRLLLILAVGVVLICGLEIFCTRFKLAVVAGESMLPTLRPGDLLIVDRRAYGYEQPRRDDIVVGRQGTGWIVKRVVGLPGEIVEVKKGTLFINGAPRREKHPMRPGDLDIAEGKLFGGDFATIGDNRAVPTMLAVQPILSRDEILGKVIFSASLIPLDLLKPSG
jgi:signal peptidase I